MAPLSASQLVLAPDASHRGFSTERSIYGVWQDLQRQKELDTVCYTVQVHGKSLQFIPVSWLIFHKGNPRLLKIRYAAVWLTEAPWFDWSIMLVVMINCVLLTHPSFYTSGPKSSGQILLSQLTAMVLLVEFLLRSIARGLYWGGWAPELPYLRSVKGLLDAFVMFACIIDLLTDRLNHGPVDGRLLESWGGVLVALRACHLLQLLKKMKYMPHMRLIILSLSNSTPQMLHWTATVLFMFTVFAVGGQSLFGATYWNRCRLTPEPIRFSNGTTVWEIDPSQDRFCGGRYECTEGTYCGSPVSWQDGVTVNYDVWPEVVDNINTNYGYTGFHHFLSACLSVLQVATMEGWTELMYRHQDGAGNILGVVFFCGLVSFTGLVLMNVLLAILWNSFLRAVREDTKTWRSIRNINSHIPQDIMSMKMHHLVAEVSELELAQAQRLVFKQLDADSSKAKGLKNICYTIAANNLFPRVMNGLIIINAGCLALDCHPPLDETLVRLSENINMFCTMMFTVEVVLKVIGLGVDFFDDGFNKFDLFCAVASLVEMFMDGSSSVSALRTARLLRLLKMMKMQVSIRVLFRVLRLATAPTINFTVIACVMIFSTATLGLHMYHGISQAESVSQLSFSNLTWSLITVFTLLSCERWTDTMFSHVHQAGGAAGLLFFVVTLSIGNLVLMNLFLGIFASMFTCSREEILVEYRERLVELRKEAAESRVEPPEAPPPEPSEEVKESPRFPTSLKLGEQKTCARDMHILKMIRIKKAANARKTATLKDSGCIHVPIAGTHGNSSLKTRLSQKYGMLGDQEGGQGRAAADIVAATRKSVTFVGETARQADSEAVQRPQARQLETTEHAAAPPGSGRGDERPAGILVTRGKGSPRAAGSAPLGRLPALTPGDRNRVAAAGQRILLGHDRIEDVSEKMPEKRARDHNNPHLRKRAAMKRPSFKELFQQARELHDAIDAAVARDRCNGTTTGEYVPPTRGRSPVVIRAGSCKLLRVRTSPSPTSNTRSPSPSSAALCMTASPFDTNETVMATQDTQASTIRPSSRDSIGVPTFDPAILLRKEPIHQAVPPCPGRGGGLSEALGSPMSPLSPVAVDLEPSASFSADRLATAVAAAVAAAEEVAAVTAAPHSRQRSRSPREGVVALPAAPSAMRRRPVPPLVLPLPPRGPAIEVKDTEAPVGISSVWRQKKLKLEPRHGASPPNDKNFEFEYTSSKSDMEWEDPSRPPTKMQAIGQRIALAKCFEPAVLFLIMISSLCLALESPFRSKDDPLARVIAGLDTILTVAFFGEMVVKMMAFGICCKRKKKSTTAAPQPPYFAMGWNWIDFIAVVSGVLDLTLTLTGVSSPALRNMRTFRLVRVLRPLRLMKRFIGIRLLVEALISSLPTLANMTVIAALFYLGFGILFVNMLKGALASCSLDPEGVLMPEIVTRQDCVDHGGEWMNDGPNFDHLGQSLLVLAFTGTGEGWIEVLLKVANSVGIDMQPRPAARLHLAILVMIFVAISNFFLLNLFIGVLVDQYMATKGELMGTENMNVKEQIWLRMQRDIFLVPRQLELAPETEAPTKKQGLEKFLESHRFQGLVFFCILANTVLLCIAQPAQSEAMRSILGVGGNVFLAIFVIEAALKIYVLRGAYFRNAWDLFDFFITAVSCASWVCSVTPALQKTEFAKILDVFRVGRTLRLGRIPYLRPMSKTIWMLIPGMINIVGLLTLVFFIYGCLGVGLFATLADGELLGHDAHFHSLGMALLTLARVSTGESWHLLMREAVQNQPGCITEEQTPEMLNRDGPRGCGTWLAYPFFISFSFFVAVVLMNLVVAIVLDGFYAVEQVERLTILRDHTVAFEQLWFHAGPEDGTLPLDTVILMFQEMGPPFGFSKTPGTQAKRWEVMLGMRHVPFVDGKRIHLRDVMVLCALRAFLWTIGGSEGDIAHLRLDQEISEEWYASFPGVPGRYHGSDVDTKTHRLQLFIGHAFVASVISSRWAMRKARNWTPGATTQMALKSPSSKARTANGSSHEAPAASGVHFQQTQHGQVAAMPDRTKELPGRHPPGGDWPITPRSGTGNGQMTTLAPNGAHALPLRALSPLPWPPPLPVRGAAAPEIVGNPPELSALLR